MNQWYWYIQCSSSFHFVLPSRHPHCSLRVAVLGVYGHFFGVQFGPGIHMESVVLVSGRDGHLHRLHAGFSGFAILWPLAAKESLPVALSDDVDSGPRW